MFRKGALAALCVLGLSSFAHAQTLANASFETPDAGSNDFFACVYNPTGPDAGWAGLLSGFTNIMQIFDGVQVGFIQNNGSIEQSVNFATGGMYQVSFQAAQRFGGVTEGPNPSEQVLRVLLDDGTLLSQGFTPIGGTLVTLNTSSVFIPAGSHTLRFAGLNPRGDDNTALLDAVRFELVSSALPLQSRAASLSLLLLVCR